MKQAEQQGAVPIQRICTPYASLKHDRKRLEAELAQSRRAAQQEARQKADMSEQLRVCQETVAAQAKSMAEVRDGKLVRMIVFAWAFAHPLYWDAQLARRCVSAYETNTLFFSYRFAQISKRLRWGCLMRAP